MEYKVFYRGGSGRLRSCLVIGKSKAKVIDYMYKKYCISIETVLTMKAYNKIVSADDYEYRTMSKCYKEIADRY